MSSQVYKGEVHLRLLSPTTTLFILVDLDHTNLSYSCHPKNRFYLDLVPLTRPGKPPLNGPALKRRPVSSPTKSRRTLVWKLRLPNRLRMLLPYVHLSLSCFAHIYVWFI